LIVRRQRRPAQRQAAGFSFFAGRFLKEGIPQVQAANDRDQRRKQTNTAKD